MPIPEPEPLGPLIRRLRRGAALSQDELAARSGVSARTISDLERGQRASAHFETLRLLADAMELAPADRAHLIRTAQSPWIDITLQRSPAAGAGRRELPTPATTLIGREREIAGLERELAAGTGRLLTLTGPGGVGKTRLALAAATAAAPHFPGGAAWVDLTPVLDPGAVMAAIADGLGLDRSGPPSSIDELSAAFGERRFLLVLDNFEQVIDAAPAIAALLAAAPALTVLVTSRAPLHVMAEAEYHVAPLALPEPGATAREIGDIDSVRLFVARARTVKRDFELGAVNSEPVADICRRLDGLPLAIELAASRAHVLAPRELLARLEQRLPLLTRGARDAPRRQQTMSDTIAWSYHLLDADAQWLFRLLSAFVGGFTLDTVEWALGRRELPAVGAVDALATLVENSLAFRVPDAAPSGRFTMYETIREFGLGQLRERQELESAYDLLATYCRRLARHGDGIPSCIVPAPWLALLDQERSNIRAAHHHLTQLNQPEKLTELTVAFGNYLYNRGPIQEAWSWFEQALAVSVSQPAALRLQVLYWASHLASHVGLTERAIELGQEALELAEAFGDASWRAAIVHCLGVIHDGSGHDDQAAALFEAELRLWQGAGVPGLSGFALMSLGGHAFRRGDLVTARSLADQAAAIFTEMGGFGWVAVTKWLSGLFAASEGQMDHAAAQFSVSLRLSVDHHTSMIHHKGLIGLAVVAAELALYERAAQLLGAAETCLEPTGQQLSPFDTSLYDQAASTCQSAMDAKAFDHLRQLGAASDHAWWIQSGEVIKRAAAERGRDRGASDPSSDTAPLRTLRAPVTAE